MQTQAGRAALLTAVDIMIEREERIDAETGEILDDQTEIASASQGETGSPSAGAEVAGANAGGGDVDRSAERAGSGNQTSDTYPLAGQVEPRNSVDNADCASGPDAKRATNSPETATNSIAKPKYVLRPNCRNPEACGGYGENHCHPCQKAMREQAEEVA
jgi:hypothetical protein